LNKTKRFITTVTFLILVAALPAIATAQLAQTWQPLATRGPIKPGAPLLLTDGSVMVQNESTSAWWKLTPDIHGGYVNGTWKQLASMPAGYAPTWFASAVLADGRVFVMGGEYNFGLFTMTNKGAIYDPTLDVWTSLAAPPSWGAIGDAQCTVLPDGRLMMANPFLSGSAILDPVTLSWTSSQFADVGKVDRNDEEGWTLLPDGTILTVDSLAAPHTERFIPSLGSHGTWIGAGNTPASLVDPVSQEMGPAILRPDGTVFATGATGHTAIYTPGAGLTDTGTWAAGPDFPICVGSNCAAQQLGIEDGPAALLPNGNVLTSASPKFIQPTQFFEFDGTRLNPVSAPSFSINNPSLIGRMLLLPSGQVLYNDSTHFESEIYTPAGGPQDSWRPTISHAPASVDPGQTFFVSGTQLNGLSQGSVYGDDSTNATNYPIGRITNIATGHVFYSRTSNHSNMGVATGATTVFTNVTVPLNIETGPSTLEVVANGIASFPLPILVGGGNATPEIQSLAPGLTSDFFNPGYVLTVNGLKFQAGDTITWTMAGSQTSLATTFVSGNQLTAPLPASLVASPDTVFVQVARADGTVSNAKNFTLPIMQQLVSSVGNANAVDAGTPGLTITVDGARFGSSDIVSWTFGGVTTQLPTTFVSAGRVIASVSLALQQPGIASITVTRGLGQVSNAIRFFIFAPDPILTAINPDPVSAGTPSFTLTLTGTWFDPTSTAMWQAVPGGAAIPLATTFVSRDMLTAVVPASFVAAPGQSTVFVDTPGVDPTQSFTFLITPPLTMTSINPGAALAELPFTMLLNGANFIDGARVALGDTLVEATVISSTQMFSNIPASLAGRYSVHVVNPGGATSAAKTLDLENPVPQISSLSPSAVPVISAPFTLTIIGTNFVTTSVARWNGTALPTTYVSSTQLVATISSTLLTNSEDKDHRTITVQNPPPGGGGSNGVRLTGN
jgi:hypothetical protein